MQDVARIAAPVDAGRSSLSTFGGMAALALAVLLPALATSSANVALPTLSLIFGAPLDTVQWIVLSYLVSLTAFVACAGSLGDRIGRKRLLLFGTAVFLVATVACAAAPTLWSLVIARVLQGVGAAVMMALAAPFAAQLAASARVGSAMGLLGSMSAVGTTLGPAVGGLLIATLGWRSIFWAPVPLVLLMLGLAWRYLPMDPGTRASPRPFDHAGAALLIAGLAAYAIGMTSLSHGLSVLPIMSLLIAIVMTVWFLVVEGRSTSPLIPIALARNPVQRTAWVASAMTTCVVMATLVVGPFYLAGTFALGALAIGVLMACGPAAAALVGVPAGLLVDRVGARATGAGALIAMASGAIALPFLAAMIGLPGYLIALVVITSGYATFQAANTTTVMMTATAGDRGLASGMLALSRNLGLVTGASLMGAVFALGTGTSEVMQSSARELADGMRAVFGLSATFLLVALAMTVRAPRPHQEGLARDGR